MGAAAPVLVLPCEGEAPAAAAISFFSFRKRSTAIRSSSVNILALSFKRRLFLSVFLKSLATFCLSANMTFCAAFKSAIFLFSPWVFSATAPEGIPDAFPAITEDDAEAGTVAELDPAVGSAVVPTAVDMDPRGAEAVAERHLSLRWLEFPQATFAMSSAVDHAKLQGGLQAPPEFRRHP